MKISVIIPTYKPKEYLWVCLNSLVQQTLEKKLYQVVVVLNGCNTPYSEKILSFINLNSEVNFLFLQTNTAGVSNARNMALDKAKGEFVTFIDDDDYVSPSYLEELLAIANQQTISLAYPFAFNDDDPDVQLSYSITNEYDYYARKGMVDYWKTRKYFSGPCMKLIHRDIIGNRRFDIRFSNGEDSLFMFLISDRMHFVGLSSRNAIYYRRFRDNSATTRRMRFSEVFTNCWRMFKVYSNYYFSNISKYKLRRYIIALLGLVHIIIDSILKSFQINHKK